MTRDEFAAFVKAEAAKFGFTQFPLTEEQLTQAHSEGVSVNQMYGVVCDVNAGLTFDAALAIVKEWTPEPVVALPEPVRTIDLTPSWASLIPVFRAILEDGSAASQQLIWQEIGRMAKLADLYVASHRANVTAYKD